MLTEYGIGNKLDFSDMDQISDNIPYRFEINTPIGRYRPDWAVVFKGEKKIYFVAETKSAGEELRESEKLKIACGTTHFKDFDDVFYKRASSVTDLKI